MASEASGDPQGEPAQTGPAAGHPAPEEPRLRRAELSDAGAIERLIALSSRGLGGADYSAAEIEGALESALGLDTQLIRDGTYFALEAGAELIACGGWSWRRTLFGGDRRPGREAAALDPARDAARIRAFYVHPGWARRGLGAQLLRHCEAQIAQRGFARAELMATRTGLGLYRAFGYAPSGPAVQHPVGPGLALELVPMARELTARRR